MATKPKMRATRLPKFIEPMKAKLVDSAPPGQWIYEIKFDGFRAVAFKDGTTVKLLSRNNKDLSERFPEIVEAVKSLKVASAILDGEIVALDDAGKSSFQLLQRQDDTLRQAPLKYYCFDLLNLNGIDRQKESLSKRKTALERILKGGSDTLRYSASLTGKVSTLLAMARKLGLEGLIGKQDESLYEAGRRSGAWIKIKLLHEQELVIGGYTDPEGARSGFGALLLGHYKDGKLYYAGKVGTGFNAKSLRDLSSKFAKLNHLHIRS